MVRAYRKPFMSVTEAAEVFDVQPITIREWCRNGILDAIRPGRDWKIYRTSIEKLAQERYGSEEDVTG